MKMSVERLRWGLAGAVVLLVIGLVALVGYKRYQAVQTWKALFAKSGIHVSQESDNVTWSQTVKGRTVFTVRAKKALPLSKGKWTLHGVTLLLYGKTPNNVDRVDGDEFEYDEKEGVAKAIGEVRMDIQAPGALSRRQPGAGQGGQAVDAEKDVIHVLTSGLVYVRKLGVAATDQRVEFRYAGLTCVSKGAEFDTEESVLHLLADVEMRGEVRGRAMVVQAAKADLDRGRNSIAVAQPVVNSGAGAKASLGRAANALLLLRPDGTLQHADASGGVMLESGGRRVAAQRLAAVFGAANMPQSAVLRGGVTLDGSAAKPMHGTAEEADLGFAAKGQVNSVLAKGGVRLVSSVARAGGAKIGGPALAREIRGEQVMTTLRPGSGARSAGHALVQQVHVMGGAYLRGETFAKVKAEVKGTPGAVAAGIETTEVNADDLLAEFAGGDAAVLQRLNGQGHARLRQVGLNGAEQVSSADSLQAAFAPDARAAEEKGAVRLTGAVEMGHVQIREQAGMRAGGKAGALSLAHGERAAFDAAAGRLTLTGGAGYQQEGTNLSASTISVEQGSGNAEAQGGVEATLAAVNGAGERAASHVLADRAKMTKAAGTAEFFGTDAHPARMWQGDSQVMAADLFLDDGKQSLMARPAVAGAMVEAVFGLGPSVLAAGSTGVSPLGASRSGRDDKRGSASGRDDKVSGARDAVHVSSPVLNYSGLRREAVCSGGVRVRQGDTQVRAQQAVMFLAGAPAQPKAGAAAGVAGLAGPAQLGGSLERVVFSGGVRLDAAGRAGDGEQLVYTAGDGNYVLTGTAGKPPRMADATQGVVTGPALVFRGGEKTVIVTGSSASNGHDGGPEAGHGGRVHTEVVVRPQQR